MNNSHILRILNESALNAKHDLDVEALRFVEANNRTYNRSEFIEFKRDLLEAGSKIRMLFMEYALDFPAFIKFQEEEQGQILFFQEGVEGLIPVLQQRRNKLFQKKYWRVSEYGLR